MTNRQLSAIIPAKEEAQTIRYLVENVKNYVDEVIVILSIKDLETVSALEKTNIKIVYEEKKGKGNALKAGVKYASNEILIFIDADLSHNPHEIPNLIEPILKGDADMVTASRMLGGSSELFFSAPQFIRLVGSHIITLLINYKFMTKLTDSQNGFRAVKKSFFERIKLEESHTTIEQELTAKMLSIGAKVFEIRSHEYARSYGKSKIKVYKHGWRYVLVLLKIICSYKRPKGKIDYDSLEFVRNWY
jgi:glycosyltransferase involved in cell wall biosynthesis